jgi:hypothetical protein
MVVGMIFDRAGRELAHQVFEGHQSDSQSLPIMIQELQTLLPEDLWSQAERPLVIADAGVATRKNLRWLRQNHFHYLANDSRLGRSRYRQEFAQQAQFTLVEQREGEPPVKVRLLADPYPPAAEAEARTLARPYPKSINIDKKAYIIINMVDNRSQHVNIELDMNECKSQSAANLVPTNPFLAQTWLLLNVPDSDFCEFCRQAHSLAVREPEILQRIEADLDRAAKEKKRLRLLDQQWLADQTAELPGSPCQSRPLGAGELKLGQGRPRLSAYMVYIFLMIRGYSGGFKTSTAQVLREESVTLTVFLANLGLKLPGASTLNEHANHVSNATRQFLLDAQIRQILGEGWDDFNSLTIDSTAVWANTGWPTDSQLMVDLARRFWQRGSKLEPFGVANLVSATVPEALVELASLNLKIQFSAGKPKSARKRKGHYARLLRRVAKLAGDFQAQWEKVQQSAAQASLPPSQAARLQRLVDWMGEDVAHLRQVAGYGQQRVMEGKTVGSAGKVLSLSDAAAGFIAKGQREPVIGYKPQLGRSRQGFIPSVVIPLGNAADVSQLPMVVEESARRTGILPGQISTDDGYACKAIREQLLASGVKVVSLSGSKGKKITSAADWDSLEYATARRERSAVESLMSTIKQGFDFGQVMRRGAEPVRAELLEKVLAYNCCRMVERQRALAKPGQLAEEALRVA